ncbi:hypothetical protein BH11ACT2_BH11ACT2_09780 [soil metagenome]
MVRSRDATLGRVAFALVLASDAAYLVGIAVLQNNPDWSRVVNIGLRIGPIWAPVLVFWIAAVSTRSRRLPLVLAALAVTAWASGDAAYNALMGDAGFVASPAPTDIGYLAFYGFLIAAFIALAAPGTRLSMLPAALEGTIASLGTASVLLVIVQPVLDSAVGRPLSAATALGLAYPVLDIAIVAMTVGYASGPALAGSRRAGWFLGGIAVFVATDLAYAFLSNAELYRAGSIIDLGWPLGLGLLSWWALGFITPPRDRRAPRSVAALSLIAPILAVIAALAVLVYASQRPVSLAAVIAATLTVALAAIPILTRQTLLSRLVAGQARVVTELRDIDGAKSEMMATLNHEMRTPLTSILGYLELVRDGAGGAVPAEADAMLGAVEHSARRLHSIVDEMLILTRLDSHGVELHLEATAPRAIAQRVVDQLMPVAAGKNVDLRFAADPGPRVMADHAQLGHALTTIVENAIKFTPAGGSVAVSVTTRDHERPVVITVRDTGMGVPAEDLPHLFERFYRASNALQSAVKGSGLGLAIAQGIVGLHNGRIRAESVVGQGTTMIVTLPAAE